MSVHIYHYNINREQRYFMGHDHRTLYDMVALNANIVAHTPGGVAGLVATTGKPFYIDPQTHAFQHNTEMLKRDVSDKKAKEPPRLEFKPSVRALAEEHLGGPFAKVIERDSPIVPEDFYLASGSVDSSVVNQVCRAVIDFQLNTLATALRPSDKEFIGENGLEPQCIIAPYFFVSSRDFERWLHVNSECYRRTVEICPDREVFYGLVLSKKVLDLGSEHVVNSLTALKPRGVLLWIDQHEEETLSKDQVLRYVNFVRDIRSVSGAVWNAHGGYLSILLCHKSMKPTLDGVGHSINYGESRAVIPVGGGIPMARFYLPPLHSRLRLGDAVDVIRSMNWLSTVDEYHRCVCKCAQCRELLKVHGSVGSMLNKVYGDTFEREIVYRDGTTVSREFPTATAMQAAARHYLFDKAREFEGIRGNNVKDIVEDLSRSFTSISAKCGFEYVQHLAAWHSALSEVT